jgi:sulfur carrier protein
VIEVAEIVVTVRSIPSGEAGEHRLPLGSRIIDLLGEMGINPEAVVVRLKGKIAPEGEQLADGDEIEIIPVVSGG